MHVRRAGQLVARPLNCGVRRQPMLRFLLGSAGGEGVMIDLPQRAQGREGWFDASVVVTVSGFIGTISAYFEIDDFVRFHAGLVSLYDTLTGTAELAPRER